MSQDRGYPGGIAANRAADVPRRPRIGTTAAPRLARTSAQEPLMTVSAEVATLFLDELARRNIPVKVNEDGNYLVEINGTTITSSLDNISREFERNRDP